MKQQVSQTKWVTKRKDNQLIYPISIRYGNDSFCDQTFGERVIFEHEIYIHISGECTVSYGNDVYTLPPGTISVYPAGSTHIHKITTSEEPYERFIVLFHYEELLQLYEDMEKNLLSIFSEEQFKPKPFAHVSTLLWQQLLSLCKKMVSYAVNDDPYNDALFYADFLKFLTIVNKAFAEDHPPSETTARSPIVDAALSYIEKHYMEVQTVDQVANHLHISHSYLARSFKKQIGIPPSAYIQDTKLKRAVALLTEGKSVTEACFNAGFNNYSYFIQMFRKKYGTTPYKFQKSLNI